MRVIVASDGIGAYSSAQAGELLAAGWSSGSSPPSVTVLPLGASGRSFVSAYAAQLGFTFDHAMAGSSIVTSALTPNVAVVQVSRRPGGSGIDEVATSSPIGVAMLDALRTTPSRRQLVVDLGGFAVHDGGAGLLFALGACGDRPLDGGVAGLEGLRRLDLRAVRTALANTDLVGVVPADQLRQPLTGLRGITSLHRDPDRPADMLRIDQSLETFARLLSGNAAARGQAADVALWSAPGGGACGGLGLAILALGGRLTLGPDLGLERVADGRVDLVVTGCEVFDFATRGGEVVLAAAGLAERSLSPCVLIAGEVVVGRREMRTMGIEAAYAVRESTLDQPTGAVEAADVTSTARRVGRSWRW